MMGPRVNRFSKDPDIKKTFYPNNVINRFIYLFLYKNIYQVSYVVIGTLLLWFDWYGFNAGTFNIKKTILNFKSFF